MIGVTQIIHKMRHMSILVTWSVVFNCLKAVYLHFTFHKISTEYMLMACTKLYVRPGIQIRNLWASAARPDNVKPLGPPLINLRNDNISVTQAGCMFLQKN